MSKKKDKYKTNKSKRKVKKYFKKAFCIIYYAVTAIVPIYFFAVVFSLKGDIIYTVAISFVSFIIMDIICSGLEDGITQIGKLIKHEKKKRQEEQKEIERQKEEEIKKLEQLVLEKNNYNKEIKEAEEKCAEFRKDIKDIKEKLEKQTYKELRKICAKIEEIVEILKEDPEEYYQIRHIFKVYFPEFIKTTYKYIDIVNVDTIDKENREEYIKLIAEFDNYLDFAKSKINSTDNVSLNVGIKSLIKIMESEREKGDK